MTLYILDLAFFIICKTFSQFNHQAAKICFDKS